MAPKNDYQRICTLRHKDVEIEPWFYKFFPKWFRKKNKLRWRSSSRGSSWAAFASLRTKKKMRKILELTILPSSFQKVNFLTSGIKEFRSSHIISFDNSTQFCNLVCRGFKSPLRLFILSLKMVSKLIFFGL
jgi:hypothetical protein